MTKTETERELEPAEPFPNMTAEEMAKSSRAPGTEKEPQVQAMEEPGTNDRKVARIYEAGEVSICILYWT